MRCISTKFRSPIAALRSVGDHWQGLVVVLDKLLQISRQLLEFRGILHVQVSGFTLQPQEILQRRRVWEGFVEKTRIDRGRTFQLPKQKQKSKSSLSPPRSTPFDKRPTQLVHLNQFLARGNFRDTLADKTHLQRLAPGYFDLFLSRLQKLQAESNTHTSYSIRAEVESQSSNAGTPA